MTEQTALVLKLLVTALVAAALSVLMQVRAAPDALHSGGDPLEMSDRSDPLG